MLVLLLPSVASLVATEPPAHAQGTVTIRVERPAIASENEWQRPSPGARREIIRLDERGRPMLLRVLEFE